MSKLIARRAPSASLSATLTGGSSCSAHGADVPADARHDQHVEVLAARRACASASRAAPSASVRVLAGADRRDARAPRSAARARCPSGTACSPSARRWTAAARESTPDAGEPARVLRPSAPSNAIQCSRSPIGHGEPMCGSGNSGNYGSAGRKPLTSRGGREPLAGIRASAESPSRRPARPARHPAPRR